MTVDFDPDSAPDDDILARTIAGEARGEGNLGMQAVACVVLNRVAKPCWWGHTIREVCLKPYQFSCWNDNDPNRVIIEALSEDKAIFRDGLDIARKVIAGTLTDITNGATSYYASGIPEPSWARGKPPCATIGHHIFFRDA